MRTCEACGKPLVKPPKGRPQTRFCSRVCKEDAYAEAQKAARLAAKAEAARACSECGKPIPPEKPGKALTCSPACSEARNARRITQRKHDAAMARRAIRPPCEQCGGPIPASVRNGARFCQRACRITWYQAEWKHKSPGYMRRYLYGITPEQWAAMWEAQDGRCAICGRELRAGQQQDGNGREDWPHADHDHETGRFRGILCGGGCNNGLGMFRDDPALLRAAAVYLEAAAS